MKCTIASSGEQEKQPKGRKKSRVREGGTCCLKRSKYACTENINFRLSQVLTKLQWLAVTHKSFDHARRGFNDRLAFLGKRIVDLQTSIALLNAPITPGLNPPAQEVFRHPALEGVENITAFAKANVLEKSRLARLASSYGVDKAVRWKPKKSDNLQGSGVEAVLSHTMFSIIGALALQRGGEVAVNVVRERILKPLGLR